MLADRISSSEHFCADLLRVVWPGVRECLAPWVGEWAVEREVESLCQVGVRLACNQRVNEPVNERASR